MGEWGHNGKRAKEKLEELNLDFSGPILEIRVGLR
jgi:hypothetical protein